MNTKTHLLLRMNVVRFDHQMGAADESIEVDCLLEMVCLFFLYILFQFCHDKICTLCKLSLDRNPIKNVKLNFNDLFHQTKEGIYIPLDTLLEV